jgi:hypothetical protein
LLDFAQSFLFPDVTIDHEGREYYYLGELNERPVRRGYRRRGRRRLSWTVGDVEGEEAIVDRRGREGEVEGTIVDSRGSRRRGRRRPLSPLGA